MIKADRLIGFFETFKIPIAIKNKIFIKKDMAVKIKIVPTIGFVGTAILLFVDLLVKSIIRKIAAAIKAILHKNTILENVRMGF